MSPHRPMSAKNIHMLVGLGNPGEEYAMTRHNLGFMVIDSIAKAFSLQLTKEKFKVEYCRGRVRGIDTFLVKPMGYMNRSGLYLRRFADYFGISGGEMLVICDDIDLAFNRLKIKEKGGHGGHNGIRSMIDAFGGDFYRLRMGVGRPQAREEIVGHVLGRFSKEEKENLDGLVKRAGDAAVTILCDGINEGMNKFNRKFC